MDRFKYNLKTRRQKMKYLYLWEQANLMGVGWCDDFGEGEYAIDDGGDGGEEGDESQLLSILL